MNKILLGLSVALTAIAVPAIAQDVVFEKPIQVFIPGAAGGGTDIGIRTWAPYFEACAGTSIVVVPRPGGNSAISITETAQAAPDGYTIGAVSMPQLATLIISSEMTFDLNSFDYIGNVIGARSTITVRKDSPLSSLSDLVDLVNESDTPINVAIGGLGADDHLGALQFQKLIGKPFNFLPFGENAAARNALLGGHVDVAFMSTTDTAAFADEVRPLAIATAERSPLFPDLPTFTEQGYPLVAGSDHVMGAPKGVPEPMLAKMRECLAEATANPDFLADAEERGLSLNLMDAAESEAFVRAQEAAYRTIWEETPWIESSGRTNEAAARRFGASL